jgi:phage shock protein C
MKKRLYRSDNRVIAGVCSGVAEYFNVDPVIVRVIWAILIFVHGIGVIAYILGWLIIPPKSRTKTIVRKTFSRKRRKR